MELPSYGWQLLPQLYPLCKEQHFCDCTIFFGNVHFRALKVFRVLPACCLNPCWTAQTPSPINASVLTPEEFALLLEMRYSGKLPLGKRNFTSYLCGR